MADPQFAESLRAAILTSRTLLSTQDVPLKVLGDKPPEQSDPHFREVIEGVLFTQKFVLTYHAAILFVLFLFTLVHWTARFRASARARTMATKPAMFQVSDPKSSRLSDSASTSSQDNSSSSRTVTPPNEQTQLLHFPRYPQPSSKASLVSRAKGFLLYQPPSIPVVNKTLPQNSTSLLVLALIGLNLFYTFYRVPLKVSALFIFADRVGALFVANLPLLYLLAAKNQPVKSLTGYSYESLNILHRRLGEIMCLYALLHSAGMVGVWYTILRPTGYTLVYFLTRKIIILGLIAFVCYELLYLTSLGSFRQRWYELFLLLHVVLQAAALFLVFFHHPRARIYCGIAFGIFVVDRLVFRLGFARWQTKATLKVLEDGRTVRLSTEWPVASTQKPSTWLQRQLSSVRTGWKPTEHVFVTVPALARKHWIQAHPFTIASAAPSSAGGVANLDLLIRGRDGFSKDLVGYAENRDSVVVQLDGPYGALHALENTLDSDIAIIVAGGSGIAVANPLLHARINDQEAQPVDGSLVERDGRGGSRRTALIWIVQHESHRSWLDAETVKDLKRRGVVMVKTRPTAVFGRPDVAKLLRETIYNLGGDAAGKQIGIVCSGPDSMNRAVRNEAASLAYQGHDIRLEVEKFGW